MSKTLSALMAVLALAIVGFGFAANSANAEQDKVGVCHRTASETNPYVFISVPADEANGHITGTDKQHNHKVTWPTDGTWRGVPHNAGDERLDYFANSAIECDDLVVEPSPTAEPTPTPTITPTPTVPVITPTPTEPFSTPAVEPTRLPVKPLPSGKPVPELNTFVETQTWHIYSCGQVKHITVTKENGKVVDREVTIDKHVCEPDAPLREEGF